MEELMEKLKKFEFLTPVLVLLNLFVTAILTGDLIKDIAEELLQDIMKETDIVVLAIILSYVLYFVGLLIIIALINKVFKIKNSSKYNKLLILLKFIICVSLIGVFGFKILLTCSMSKMSYFMKLLFGMFQFLIFLIVFCCIIKVNINDINGFNSLFFIDEDNKKTVWEKIYKISWGISILILLSILSYIVMILFGIDIIEIIEKVRKML